MNNYKIVDVPPKMQKFFGSGKMLHPTLKQVAEVVQNIPEGQVRTMQEVCDQLATAAGSDVTCPMRTGNAIKKMSKTAISHDLPFWRVIRSDGQMIKLEDQDTWAARLAEEGAIITYTKNGSIKVQIP